MSRRRPTPRTAVRTVAVVLALASLSLAPGALAAGPSRNAAATAASDLAARSATTSVIKPNFTISPSTNPAVLQNALAALRPGDVLALRPGIYHTNYLQMYAELHGPTTIRPGAANAPITVTSLDPANPAVLYGGLQLYYANYWHLSNLIFIASPSTVRSGTSALFMGGGVGWSVTGSVFTGARATGSFANVAIAETPDHHSPSRFTFSGNCVYNAGTAHKGADQNIYVSFPGSAATSGTISRNIIYAAPQGQAIKLGNGGTPGALGPWNVVVSNNTMVSNGRQVLLFGNVRNNTIVGNLFVTPTAPFTSNPQTTQMYVSVPTGTRNSIRNNYGYAASMFSFDPAKAAATTGNYQSNGAWANPEFNGQGCGAFVPKNPSAAKFGRYGITH